MPRKQTPKKMKPGPRGNPEATRAAILNAALQEFAQEGVAGARTDAIAKAAGVNKALLYYYYKDKEALYGAVLDHVFSGLYERLSGVLDQDLPAREKILAYAAAHFDYIATSPLFPRVVLGEMMHGGRRVSPHLEHVVTSYFRPLLARLMAVFADGMAKRQIREVDPQNFMLSMVAMNVFYFASAEFQRTMNAGVDPLSPERIAARRAAVLDILDVALTCPPRDDQEKG